MSLIRNGIPADIYTLPNGDKRRIKVSTSTAQEFLIAQGSYYVGSSERGGVPIGDDYYSVLKAAPDKYLVIEDATVEIDFSQVTNGQYSVALTAFSEASNGNSWTYTPSSPSPVGRPLNCQFINNLPISTVDIGVIIPDLTGVFDFPLFFSDYFIDTQGNRESISDVGANFFEAGRQIIIPPGETLLVRTQTGGDALGTAFIRTIFFTTEIGVDIFPLS